MSENNPMDALWWSQEVDQRLILAELIANFRGSSEEAFSKLNDLHDAAQDYIDDGWFKEYGKVTPPPVVHLVKIALSLSGGDDASLIKKASALWISTERFQRDRVRKKQLTSAVWRSNYFATGKSIKPPQYLIDYVFNLNLSEIERFDQWLSVMMPAKTKKVDRVARFRLFLGSPSTPRNLFSLMGHLDDGTPKSAMTEAEIDALIREAEQRFRRRQASFGTHYTEDVKLREVTVLFMTWDKEQSQIARSSKARKAASAKHQKKNPGN